ncbi:MAG: biopolymer transporter ExbD [Fibrobacter sp.]|nr:biopolymer transporter ExbD [Fibrobacter sp.]
MASLHSDDDEIITSINITPLVDIFLVLLIIFMITSTVVTQQQIPLNVPKAAHAGSKAPEAVGLVVDKEGMLYLDGVVMDSSTLLVRLRTASLKNPGMQVLIAADRELLYQKVINAIDLVRAAGISKYALKVVRP